jgi:hypothetical protein
MNLSKPLGGGLSKACARLPAPQAAWIHQIHTAGGQGGSNTMVAVFVSGLCFVLWSRDVTSSSYVETGTKKIVQLGVKLSHIGLHHTLFVLLPLLLPD